MAGEFMVKFWGVCGTSASPGQETVRYGGNTSCVEVRCGDRLFILDSGSGLRKLGAELAQKGPVQAVLLFHHDPDHDDDFMDDIERKAKERFKGSVAAREGMVFKL